MSKVKHIFLGCLVFLVVFFSSFQTHGVDFFKQRENALKPGRFQLGPFQIFSQITLENAGYTNNVYGYKQNPQPGWMADLGANLRAVAVVGQRLVLALGAHPYYSYFSSTSTERAFNHTLSGNIYTWLAGVHLNYGFKSANTRQRPNPEFAARVRYITKSHQLEAELGNHNALFFSFLLAFNTMEYGDDGFMSNYTPGEKLDRRVMDAGFKINLPIFTASTLSLAVNLQNHRFANTITRNGNALSTTIHLSLPEIGHLTGNASLGYKRYFPDLPTYAEFDTLYGNGTITYRFLRRWRLQVNYSVDNRFSFINEEFYFNQRSIQTGLDYYMSNNLRIGGSFRIGRLDYRQLQDGSLLFRDNNQQYEVRLAFRLAESTGIGLTFSRQEFDSERLDLQRGFYFIGGFVTHDF